MPTALIKLACQHIIDAQASTAFERQVFDVTYKEFLLQQQSFSKGLDLPTWSAIKEKFPRSNPTLPFKVSFAIAGLMQSLDKKIPGLTDTLNIKPIHFVNHYFQLLESDINDPSAHKVSIIYITGAMTYFGAFGDRLLLAFGDTRQNNRPYPELSDPGNGSCGYSGRDNGSPAYSVSGQGSGTYSAPAQTFLLRLEERLSIVSYEEWSRTSSEISAPPSCALPAKASLFP